MRAMMKMNASKPAWSKTLPAALALVSGSQACRLDAAFAGSAGDERLLAIENT